MQLFVIFQKVSYFISSVPLGHWNITNYFILKIFKYVTITHIEKSTHIFYY